MASPLSLFNLLQELKEICQQADQERAGVWIKEFSDEYPEIVLDIEKCAEMSNPSEVIDYLTKRDPAFAMLRLFPAAPQIIEFLQRVIRERKTTHVQSQLTQ